MKVRVSVRLLSGAFCALLLLVAIPAMADQSKPEPAASAQATPWPQAQGGPDHLGDVPTGPQPPYRVAWEYSPEEAAGGFSAAVIAGDSVYAASAKSVVGVSLADGTQQFSIDRADGPILPPVAATVAGHPAVLFLEGKGNDTKVVAYDTKAAKRLWEVELDAASAAGLTLAGDRAYVGTTDATVTAIDLATGEVAWKHEGNGEQLVVAVAVDDEGVYYSVQVAAKRTSRFLALDPATGKQRWSKDYPVQASTPLSIAGDTLYAATIGTGQVVALDKASGDTRWTVNLRSGVSPDTFVALSNDRLYTVDQVVGLYSVADGQRLWDFQENGTILSSGAPVALGDTILVGLEDGSAIAVDTVSGHLVWRGQIAGAGLRAPAVAGERVVFGHGGADGGLVAIDHTDGPLLDEASPTVIVPGKVATSFAIAIVAVSLVLALVGRFAGPWLRAVGRGSDDDEDADDDTDDLDEDADA